MYQLLADTLPNYPYQTTTPNGSGGAGAFIMTFFVIELIALVFYAVCLYKVFQKAGKPGWAGIVPIYNSWVLFELTGLPSWMAILLVIPFINIIPVVMSLVAYYRLAGLFGKSSGFGVLMVLLPVIGLPILAFGDAQFRGNAGNNATSPSYGPQNPSAAPYATTPQSQPPAAMPPATDGPTDTQPPVGPSTPPTPPSGPVSG